MRTHRHAQTYAAIQARTPHMQPHGHAHRTHGHTGAHTAHAHVHTETNVNKRARMARRASLVVNLWGEESSLCAGKPGRPAAAPPLCLLSSSMAHTEGVARRAAQAFGTAAGGRKGSAAPAYIRISEQEIADDYPLPKQYNKGGWARGAAHARS